MESIYTARVAMEQKRCDDAKLAASFLSGVVALLLMFISSALVWYSRHSRQTTPSKQDATELLQRFQLDSDSEEDDVASRSGNDSNATATQA